MLESVFVETRSTQSNTGFRWKVSKTRRMKMATMVPTITYTFFGARKWGGGKKGITLRNSLDKRTVSCSMSGIMAPNIFAGLIKSYCKM